jgi:hypothetical protein
VKCGRAYQAPLAVDDDDALVDALARNVSGVGETASASPLAPDVRRAARQLVGQDCTAFTRGELNLPEPDAVQALAPAANR